MKETTPVVCLDFHFPSESEIVSAMDSVEETVKQKEDPVTLQETSEEKIESATSHAVSSSSCLPVSLPDKENMDDMDKWQPQGDPSTVTTTDTSVTSSSLETNNHTSNGAAAAGDSMKRLHDTTVSTSIPHPKKPKIMANNTVSSGRDPYCWYCHKKDKGVDIHCLSCPRSFHRKCIVTNKGLPPVSKDWPECIECNLVRVTEKRPAKSMRGLPVEDLNQLILLAVESLQAQADHSFHVPVFSDNYPDYDNIIVHPISLKEIETKAKANDYRSPFDFLGDIKWIFHNSSVYNNGNHPLTNNARQLVKNASSKVSEMETCPYCFKHLMVQPKTFFAEVCNRPHTIVWAKGIILLIQY